MNEDALKRRAQTRNLEDAAASQHCCSSSNARRRRPAASIAGRKYLPASVATRRRCGTAAARLDTDAPKLVTDLWRGISCNAHADSCAVLRVGLPGASFSSVCVRKAMPSWSTVLQSKPSISPVERAAIRGCSFPVISPLKQLLVPSCALGSLACAATE